MKLTNFLCLLLLCIGHYLSAQNSLNAYKIENEIVIDGMLDEEDWSKAEIANNFVHINPDPGKKADFDTRVKVLYDNEALYISAEMDEVSRDSILTELTQRDNVGNTDVFAVILDTYNNGTDGIVLLVSATGVQYDAKKENEGYEDSDWDAVWFSEVNLTDNGWTCEIKVPYAAIRFPKLEEQQWSINFTRTQRRTNISSSWNEIKPEVNGIHTQSGKLVNIKNIEPPTRISITPYLSTYALHYHDTESDPINSTGYSYNAGMDVKYGINDAFTLDMTLIPDFGQVEADDLVVNLSPFEVYLTEKRPFFTEGLELFSKGDIFYTRRVGGTAFDYWAVEDELKDGETIISNPQIPQLYNATKLSGRNTKGLGIGIFNAIEAETTALIENRENQTVREQTTHPLTNYNLVVVDQNLKNNSYLSIVNSNVWRRGSQYYNANVFATDFDLKDKNQKYAFGGQAAYSLKSVENEENITGHRLELQARKISGNWKFWTGYDETSQDYDHNDLGFLRNANDREFEIGVEYSIYDPIWKINRANFWFEISHSRLYEPNVFTDNWYNWGFWMQTTGFWNVNMWFNYGTARKDYWEPRTDDFSRYIIRPNFKSAGFWVGSDNRKPFRISLNGNLHNIAEEFRWGYFYAISPRYRFNDNFTLSFSWNYNIQFDDTGWVETTDENDIILGQRDIRRVTSLLSANYTFNNRMGLNLRTRHNWTAAIYDSFHLLDSEGGIPFTEYAEDLDFSSSFFSVDLGFNWRFAPGSDISLVWKNNISGSNEDEDINIRKLNYHDSLKELGDFAQQNSLSLRITYYLDQTNFRNWLN